MKQADRTLLAQLATCALTFSIAYALRRKPRRDRQVVVITGGSRGLGLALAERYGREGALLVLAARDPDELERARSLLLERKAIASAQQVLLAQTDLNEPSQARELVHRTLAHFGRIDILINNAGIIEVGPLENQTLQAYERAMSINFYAALHTTYAALPFMLRRFADPAGRGRMRSSIVNISSVGGKFAMPHLLPYVASKFALTGFSEGLHAEVKYKGVDVTTVCPGLMRTGSHVQANFTGDHEAEYQWFTFGATTPFVAASAKYAADVIFKAVQHRRAEVTITPQAWLAARTAGIAPGLVQGIAALVSRFLLPASVDNVAPGDSLPGKELESRGLWVSRKAGVELQVEHNQVAG